MLSSETYNKIFDQVVETYHRTDDVDTPIANPYDEGTLPYFLYLKCWIDAVQWHLEDIIRDPGIDPAEALKIKRRIDKSNQDRTDVVEMLDTRISSLESYLESRPPFRDDPSEDIEV